MKQLRSLFLLACIVSFSSGITHGDATYAYREEFKAFQTNPHYKVVFDKDANGSLKSIQADVEIYKDLSYFQRLIRFAFSGLEIVIVKPETMPKLYSFIDTICKDQGIETPTIFIAQNRGFFNATASKLLTSSGTMVIGQKLLEETSDKELQGIMAHELGHIVYNHMNKTILISIGSYYGTKWIRQYFFNVPDQGFDLSAHLMAVNFIAPCIINKRFEREADEFAYKVTNNGEGLVEFFEHLEKKEQSEDNDFDATKALVKDNYSKIGFTDYYWLMTRYYLAKAGHNIGKGFAWVYHNTPLGAHPAHEDRIKAAQEYLAQQQA